MKIKHNDGFTLVETLVALTLGAMIVLGVTTIFIEGLRHVHGVRAQVLLITDAGYMVQMIRNDLVRASDVTVDSGSTDQVSIVRTASTEIVRLEDGRVLRNDVPMTREGVAVTNLHFEEVGKSLRITFTLESRRQPTKTFDGQTTLALRN